MPVPCPSPRWQFPAGGLRDPGAPLPCPALTLTSAAQRLPQHLASAQVTPAPAAPQRQVGEAVPLASLHRDAGVLRLLEDAPHVAGPGRSRPPPQSLLQTRPERASGARGPRLGLWVPPGRPPGAAPLVRPGRSREGRGGAAARGAAGRRRRLGAAQALQVARPFWVQEQPVGTLPDGRGRHGHAGLAAAARGGGAAPESASREGRPYTSAPLKGPQPVGRGGGGETGARQEGRSGEPPAGRAAAQGWGEGAGASADFGGVCGKPSRRLGQLKRRCCRDGLPSALPPRLSPHFPLHQVPTSPAHLHPNTPARPGEGAGGGEGLRNYLGMGVCSSPRAGGPRATVPLLLPTGAGAVASPRRIPLAGRPRRGRAGPAGAPAPAAAPSPVTPRDARRGTLPRLTAGSRLRGERGWPPATFALAGFPLSAALPGRTFLSRKTGVIGSWALDGETALSRHGWGELIFRGQTVLSPRLLQELLWKRRPRKPCSVRGMDSALGGPKDGFLSASDRAGFITSSAPPIYALISPF